MHASVNTAAIAGGPRLVIEIHGFGYFCGTHAHYTINHSDTCAFDLLLMVRAPACMLDSSSDHLVLFTTPRVYQDGLFKLTTVKKSVALPNTVRTMAYSYGRLCMGNILPKFSFDF